MALDVTKMLQRNGFGVTVPGVIVALIMVLVIVISNSFRKRHSEFGHAWRELRKCWSYAEVCGINRLACASSIFYFFVRTNL